MVDGRTQSLVLSFINQWARTWGMWEAMIHSISDEEWTKGDHDYLIPARRLIHAAVADDFFSSDTPFDQYDQPKWFGVGEWETSPVDLPDKATSLDTLAGIRGAVEARLTKLDDAALLEAELVHPWAGQTRLGKLLFNLRHIQDHLGEVNAEMIRRGFKGVGWK